MTDNLAFHTHSSGILFILAKQAAKRAYAAKGTLGEQYETLNAVILCAVVAEASINAMGEWFNFHHSTPPLSSSHGMPHEFESLKLRAKWSLFPIIVRQKSFDTGSEPWQSFNALIDLRNMIVHLKGSAIPKSVSSLLKTKKLYDGSFLGFEVAKWACHTISLMFEALTQMLELPKNWEGSIWLFTPNHSFPFGLSTPGDKVVDAQLR